MAVTDPPAMPAQAPDAAVSRPARAEAPPGDPAGPSAASPAKVTASTAPYVTRPTQWTLFLRTFVPWQLWRFIRINAKMIRIIRGSRT
jgi:hypothetical protein